MYSRHWPEAADWMIAPWLSLMSWVDWRTLKDSSIKLEPAQRFCVNKEVANWDRELFLQAAIIWLCQSIWSQSNDHNLRFEQISHSPDRYLNLFFGGTNFLLFWWRSPATIKLSLLSLLLLLLVLASASSADRKQNCANVNFKSTILAKALPALVIVPYIG